jgi:hypothetical protein
MRTIKENIVSDAAMIKPGIQARNVTQNAGVSIHEPV